MIKEKNIQSSEKKNDGFEKSKLASIPEGWEIKTLGNLGEFLKGKGVAKKEVLDNGIPCVRYGEIYTIHHEYIKVFNSFINKTSAEDSFKLEKGDLLFAGSGEKLEDIGKCVAFLNEFNAYAGGDIVVLRNHQQNAMFMGFLLNTPVFRRQAYKLGQGHSVVHIYSSGLKNVKIPLPPLPEQQKIATILSKWDNAIDKLTQLIAAKEQRKKGLMQVLLTGKKRFSGFSDKWKEVKLESVCEKKGIVRGPFGGALKKEIFVVSGYKVYEQKNAIYKSVDLGGYFVDETKYIEMSRFAVKQNDLLISCSGTIGRIFRIPEYFPKGIINQALLKLTVDSSKVDVFFFEYLLNSNKIQSRIVESTQGGAMKNLIGMSEFRSLKFTIPSIKEQQKIASVFSAADKEIENLKTELESLQEQKKGLMQHLLTGKIRV